MAQTETSDERRERLKTDGRIVVGIVAALVAAFALTSLDAVVFNLRIHYGVIETQLIRNVAGVLFVVSLMLFRREPLLPRFKGVGIAIFRGVTIVPIGFLFFSSFKLLDQGTATALVFTYPIVITILAAIILREKTGFWRWGAVLIGFGGVILVQVALWMARGDEWSAAEAQPLWITALYSLMPILAAVFFAVNMISLRFVPKGPPSIWITYVGALAALSTIIPIWFFFGERVPLNWSAHWWQFVLLAICSVVSAQGLNIAYRSAPASVVGSLEYVAIIFATGFAWFSQGLIPPNGIWFGVALIFIAGVVTAWREARAKEGG